jgi:hypothetical protein
MGLRAWLGALTVSCVAGVFVACVGDTTPQDGGVDSSANDALADTSVKDTGSDASDGGVEAGFDPKSIAGLRMWFKADKGVDVSDAGTDAGPNVTTWHDQSGNAIDAVPNVGATYLPACPPPQLAAGTINNLPALSFLPPSNGAVVCLQLPQGFSDFTAGATVFALTRVDITQSNTTFFGFGLLQGSNNNPANPLSQFSIQRALASLAMGNWPDLVSNDYGTLSSASNSAGDVHQVHMFEWVLNAGSAGSTATGTWFMDGNQLTSGTDAVAMKVPEITTRTMNTIGWAGRNPQQLIGLLGELLFYSGPLKTSDRLLVEQYLRAKWASP